MIARPCVRCGEPVAAGSYCDECRPPKRVQPQRPAKDRGYDAAWFRLSRRARRLQPWCSDCGTTEDLTCDHLPGAWERVEAGLPLRLVDVEVVCRSCNSRRGASRGLRAESTRGGSPRVGSHGPAGKAQEPLHTAEYGSDLHKCNSPDLGGDAA